jgi:uncharacterized repeat protein (TIGR01451 family)
VVVGAIWEDSNATGVGGNQADNSASNSGAAYVFVRSGSTWSQQAYLKASNTRADDQFGSSVAILGNTAVVGAPLEDSNATGVDGNQADNTEVNSGATYVFVRSGSSWSQQAYLKASNTGGGDQFGYNMAISGDTVVVGAFAEASNATGVNGNQGDNTANASGAAYIFQFQTPDLSLTKADGGSSVAPGGTVAYSLTYANNGAGATGVTLTETVPANATFNPGASTVGWSCVPSNNAGSTCTLAIGSVAASAGGSATFAVTVANPLPAGVTEISNTASIADDGANGTDPTPGNNTGADTTPVTGAPDLSLTKSDGGASVAPGGTVSYTLSYSNTGNRGASGVVLTETVPANSTFNAGASTAGWSCVPNNNAGSTCTLAIGTVAGGGTGSSATFVVTVANPLPAGITAISNTAAIADDGANGTDPNAGNNSASDTTPVTGAPDLSVTKSDAGASVAPGGTVSFTLSYSNTGNRGASGVVLTETVPANTTFNPGASTAGWSCVPNNNAGSTCTLAIGTVAGGGAGSSATFVVTVANPLPAGITAISNTAAIADDGASGTDPNAGNNSASDTTPVTGAPDLSVTKSDAGASVAPGGTVSYTLSYSNTGNRGASGVTLTETVPANTTFNPGASTAGWSCVPNNSAGSTCTLAIGSVAGGGAGSSATFAVTVANPLPAGIAAISNTAVIADDSTNGTDPNAGNNSASDTTPVTGAPDLSVTKSDGGASVAPGGTVAYTLSYSNTGNRGASGVVLTETVPANTTFNPGASTAGWSCVPNNNAGSTCTLAIGTVAGGGAGSSATFAVTVANPVPGGVTEISNTAAIADDGANGTDTNPGNNSAADTTPVVIPTADVSATKTVSPGPYFVGDPLTYTIILSNTGSGAQGDNPGDELIDVLPASLALVSANATSGTAFANLATNTVTWNGTIHAAGAVTVTIQASILPAAAGSTVVNQGDVAFDGDANGTNEATTTTDDPAAGGAADATAIQVVGSSVVEIPTLDGVGLGLLALGLGGLTLRRLRRSERRRGG